MKKENSCYYDFCKEENVDLYCCIRNIDNIEELHWLCDNHHSVWAAQNKDIELGNSYDYFNKIIKIKDKFMIIL